MKKPITLLLCLVILAGCKKNNPDPTLNLLRKIEGKWYIRKQVINEFGSETQIAPTYTGYIIGGFEYIQFNKDGTGTSNYHNIYDPIIGSIGSFTYTVSNSNLFAKYQLAQRNGFSEPDMATISFIGDSLVLHRKELVPHFVAYSYFN